MHTTRKCYTKGHNIKNTPVQVMSLEALEQRLNELHCDPLTLSASIARGELQCLIHPNLDRVRSKWANVLEKLASGTVSIDLLNDFWGLVEESLQSTVPSAELRSKHILSLNEYLYSKKKSIENINKTEYVESIEELSDEQLAAFLRDEDVNVDIGNELQNKAIK